MSKSRYPRITRYKPYRGHPNGHPPCPICGEKATGRIEIQVSYMRGEDEYRPRCLAHKEDMTLNPPPLVFDSDGVTVRPGDRLRSSYGIPPAKIVGMVTAINGELWVLTPGHDPERCTIAEFKEHLGEFWKVTD